jgi:prepilin-type N-terminal cleavage/methylation domain-containing protein
MSAPNQHSRSEAGLSLIELLIAMVVLSLGIAALVAGFSSGILTVARSAKASTAGAVADRQMEAFRGLSYGSIAVGSTSTTTTASNGATYRIGTDVTLTCIDNAAPSGSPPACLPVGGVINRPLKLVTIVVRDDSNSKVLFREASTFDASTG